MVCHIFACNAVLYSSMGDANFFKLRFFAKVIMICFALMVIRHYFWNVICLQYFCITFLHCNAIFYYSIGDADFFKLRFATKVTVICFALIIIRHYFWKVICLQYFYITFLQCNAILYPSIGDADFLNLRFAAKVTVICFALMVIRHYFWKVICLQYFCSTFLQCSAILYPSIGGADFFKLRFAAKVIVICFALMVIRHYFWKVICLQYFCITFLQCNAIIYPSIGDADFFKLRFVAKVTMFCFALMVIRHYFWKVICL